MEKHHKFSIWHVLLGVWVALLFKNYLSNTFAIKTIPYSEFLSLLKQNKVTEVAITANQIQGKMKLIGTGTKREQMFKTVRVYPNISELLEQYGRALGILREKENILEKGARLLLQKEKIEGDEIKALTEGKS